jgi:hypothetical protein
MRMETNRPLALAALAWGAVLLMAAAAPANIVGPYTADGNTMHLYHLDEASGGSDPGNPFLDTGSASFTHYNLTDTGGFDGRDNIGGGASGGYGATTVSGFGAAFNVLKSGNGAYHNAASSSPVGGGALTSTVNNAGNTQFQSATGAFTYELLVNTSNITDNQYLLSRDGATRGWGLAINGGNVFFQNYYDPVNGLANTITAAIPTTGPNAFVANSWFHVAITYNGAQNTANNLSIYWTAVTNTATQANLISQQNLLNDANAGATNQLYVGSFSRGPFRLETEGQVDEVRISNLARTADQFIFAPTPTPTIALSNALAPGNIIIGGSAVVGATISDTVSGSTPANYSITGGYSAGAGALGAVTNGSGAVSNGSPVNFSATATPTQLGINTVQFTATSNNATNTNLTINSSVTVLDHSDAAFVDDATPADNDFTLDFGTLTVGGGTQSLQFQIENLLAGFRAGLDLDLITETSDPSGKFSTDAVAFSNLANGGLSSFFDVFLDTSTAGVFNATYTFNLSDQDGLSGSIGGQVLTLHVSAIVIPEPAALPAGLALLPLAGLIARHRHKN